MKLRYLLALSTVPALLVPVDDELFGLLSLVGWIALSLGVAARLRPSVARLWPPRRLPGGSELAAVVVGLGVAFAAIGLGVWLFSTGRYLSWPPGTQDQPAEVIAHAILGLALFLAVLPSALWLWRARPGGTPPSPPVRPPLWPCLASLLAAGILGLAAGVLLHLLEKLFGRFAGREDLANLAVLLPSILMIGAAAGSTWLRALRAGETTRIEARGLVATGLVGAVVGFSIVVAGAAAMLAIPALGAPFFNGQTVGLACGLAYAIVVMAAWLIALRGLARLPVDSVPVSAAALAVVAPAVFISFIPAAMLVTTDVGWASLVAVLSIPILAIDVALILLVGWLVRVIVRQAARLLAA